MQFNNNKDNKQKMLEFIILLILGCSSEQKISVLHLQKEAFLIQNFHPDITKEFFNFIKHHKGPFSRDINETIRDPLFLENCWQYLKPSNEDKLTGGYVSITSTGKDVYEDLLSTIKNVTDKEQKENLLHLITGIKILTDLYNKLNPEELLLLIYDTYPKYIEKSSLYYQLNNKRPQIARQLFKKGHIDKDRCKSLANGGNR